MPRTYDVEVARQEFDYFTQGWRDCPLRGVQRVMHQVLEIAKLLPPDDPRHITLNEMLERIQGRETP